MKRVVAFDVLGPFAASDLRRRLLEVFLALAVLALALAGAQLAWDRERHAIEGIMQADFETRARETAAVLRERILANEQALHATVGLFNASDSVEAGEFAAFVGGLDIGRVPGLRGIGYVRADGADRSRLAYFEPANRRLAIPGSAPYAEPSRRPAMAAARDTGQVAVANKKKLPEENEADIQGGLRMYLPVYRRGAPVDSVAARRAALAGWVFAAFDADGLMDRILGERNDIVVDLYDGADMLDETLLIDTQRDRVGGESELKLLRVARPVEIGGYVWTLWAQALPNFATPLALERLKITWQLGVAVSIALAALTWLALRRRTRMRLAHDELRDRKDAAEHEARLRSHLLAAASHDLRQPLHALGMFTERLGQFDHPPRVASLVANIGELVDALSSLLDALLDMSRLNAGLVKADPVRFPLQGLLKRLSDEYSPLAAHKGLLLSVRHVRWWIESDPVLLERILRNLLTNAIRYTNSGGILLGCRRRAGRLRIEVWDTGRGIPAESQREVFREFVRIGDPAHDRSKGLGLGLAIVDRTAQLLGHPIGLCSRAGRGSMFHVTVPLASDVAAAESRPASLPGHLSAPMTVVVVDDDLPILHGMRELLEGWGCRTVTASSGEEALAALAPQCVPDLLLCDYLLAEEGNNGFDVIRFFRERFGDSLPAAMITGETDAAVALQAEALQLPLLHKPVRPARLRALLNHVESGRASAAE